MLKTEVCFLVDLNIAVKAKLLWVSIFIISTLKQKPYFSQKKYNSLLAYGSWSPIILPRSLAKMWI